MKNYYVLCKTLDDKVVTLKTKASSKRAARTQVKKLYKNVKSTVSASTDSPFESNQIKKVAKDATTSDISNNSNWIYKKRNSKITYACR